SGGHLVLVWNGDDLAGGAGWAVPSTNPITRQSAEAVSGVALLWEDPSQSAPWSEWGWNWRAWQQPGTDVSAATAFGFALKITGDHPPDDVVVTLRSAINQKYAHQPPPP